MLRGSMFEFSWLTGGENFVSMRDQFILYAFVDF